MNTPVPHRRRAALIGLTALALAAPAGAAAAYALPTASTNAAAAAAGSGLTASFASTSSWAAGYSGGWTVRNPGTQPAHGWRLEFDLPTGAAISSIWDGTASATSGHVTITPSSWSAELAAGGSAAVGLVVTHPAGSTGLPTGCLIDGGPCTAGTSPTATPSSTTQPSTTTQPPSTSTQPPATSTRPPATTQPPATATTTQPASTGPGAALGACQHFSTDVPPSRTAGPPHDAATQAPRIDLSGHLPAPATVTGSLSGGSVKLNLSRVSGAAGYRVWRNGQSVAWLDDWGQASLTVTDAHPCRGAYYTVAALRSDASDASTGRLSTPYRLGDDGIVKPGPLAVGTSMTLMVTSYDDQGQTASGLNSGVGRCAVDARRIPWGTRVKVDGYGYCYAADIGTWIQGDIIDVWLPNPQSVNWGVQTRTVTVVAAD